MDTYSDDLATLVEALDLRNAIHVGHSTGGGEVTWYLGRHGTQRVAKAVLISASPLGLATVVGINDGPDHGALIAASNQRRTPRVDSPDREQS
jgi:pimeloyl-ACP methyl ester carboxylesterase